MDINVANHLFNTNLPLAERFCPYLPFATNVPSSALFSLNVDPSLTPKKCLEKYEFPDENGRICVGLHETGYQISLFDPIEDQLIAIVQYNNSFKKGCIKVFNIEFDVLAINNALMMQFAFASATHQTLLTHSSVVIYNGKGYLFIGKSGTGKSTHTRLWLDHIDGCQLLNDDNPAIRFHNGVPYVYGTPWSGKNPCYKNESYPIGGVVRLHQAPQNSICQLRGAKALASILPSLSTLPCHKIIQESIINTATLLVEKTPFYALSCRPDSQAATLCLQTITHPLTIR